MRSKNRSQKCYITSMLIRPLGPQYSSLNLEEMHINRIFLTLSEGTSLLGALTTFLQDLLSTSIDHAVLHQGFDEDRAVMMTTSLGRLVQSFHFELPASLVIALLQLTLAKEWEAFQGAVDHNNDQIG